MQFGLWVEPEMVNLDSDVARAHPEWILATGGRWPVPSRFQQVINLGHPDCYAYIRDALLAILDEYPISYLKWDHNRDLIDAGRSPGGEPGVHAQTLATYRLMAELKRAHPGLEIESCSSGGGRVDLGVMEIADRVWVSDCIDPLERQQMLPLDDPAAPAGDDGLAHRLRPLAHHRADARPVLPGGDRGVRAPGDRVGPGPGQRGRAGRAGGVDRVLQGAPRAAAGWRPGAAGLPRPGGAAARGGGPGPVRGALRLRRPGGLRCGADRSGDAARSGPGAALPGPAGDHRPAAAGPVPARLVGWRAAGAGARSADPSRGDPALARGAAGGRGAVRRRPRPSRA